MNNSSKPTRQQLVDKAMNLIELDDNQGICHSCGYEQDYCEPDAREYECEDCGERAVYGAMETLLMKA